mgnify:CR=1 FL=1
MNCYKKKLIQKLCIYFLTLFISLNAYSAWDFHSSSHDGETFFINNDLISLPNGIVYFWYLKNYLLPNQFGDMSAKVNVKGDCNNNRMKYLTYIWYSKPMGMGKGVRSDKESSWDYPKTESVGIDMLKVVCSHNK